jgi:1-acyl-sn-glycerol-3-phosphate acyltransferase
MQNAPVPGAMTMSESESQPAPVARKAPFRFLAAWVFSVVYWPSWVVCIMALSAVSALFMKLQARWALGQKTIATALGSYVTALEWLGIVRVDDEALRECAAMPGPLIIACNHPAIWDAPMIMRRIGRVICVMKTDIGANPLLGSGARFAGYVPNSPRLRMIREAVKRLQEGGRLLLFPEGTRTRRKQGLINPFRPGLALIAKQSGAPVLPIFIHTDSDYSGKGWPIWKMSEFPVSIRFRVGKPVQIEPGERVREFTERLEAVFRDGLE